jgi:ubiquinone/menaquinone biosynthesis C-methylase UbiE/uncharacterized protein YbaR (Trm112 family)
MKYRLLDLLSDPVDGTRLRVEGARTRSVAGVPHLTEVKCADFCGLMGRTVANAQVTAHDCAKCYASEIVEGTLVSQSGRRYPIVGGIPRMLSSAAAGWVKKNQETFSLEWKMFRFGERNWGQDMSYRRHLFLKGMATDPARLRDKVILDAGCGSGALSIELAESLGMEVVALDLAYGIEQAYAQNKNPFVHFVQASVMEPPVRAGSVDFAYCAGVLVAVPDAKAGFKALTGAIKSGGRYFIWMYHPIDKRHHPNDLLKVSLYNWIRTHITSRLPIRLQHALYLTVIPLYILKRSVLNLFRTEKNRTTWREKMQDLTDAFSPIYQHRYSEEEIVNWFNDAGFAHVDVAYQEQYGFAVRGDKPVAEEVEASIAV